MNRLACASASFAATAVLALTACGGSSSGGGGGGGSGGGGDFCSNAQTAATQFAEISKQFNNQNPSQTPSVDSIKQVISAAAQAFDNLDSQAPSAIASDFHAVRQALDTANSQAQSATTFDQITAAFQPLGAQSVQTSSNHVTNYLEQTCHITPMPT